ncbi:putative transcription factor & chromatin remodeling ARID family [Helianthus debilis subsp. tardiflorus]
MIIRALEFHDFADCKALLDMIDDRDYVFKYKYDLEKKFEEMVKWFLNVYMGITSRPVPPYSPNKRRIDLLSLYVLVARDNGYLDVTTENIWPIIAKDLGFDYQDGDYMRIIYAMYLDVLEYYYKFKLVQEKVYDKKVVNEEEGSSHGYHERRKSAGDAQDEAASEPVHQQSPCWQSHSAIQIQNCGPQFNKFRTTDLFNLDRFWYNDNLRV